jgi:enoyl-CoA hydratase/carnithine racemase
MDTTDTGAHRETGTPEILCHVRERVAILTFNRPEAKNALTMDMKEALYILVRELEADPKSVVSC